MKKWLLLFCLASTLHATEDKTCTWNDRNGVVRWRTEPDAPHSGYGAFPKPRGKEDELWTWKDTIGVVRSRAELDALLQEYKTFVETQSNEGRAVSFFCADLKEANLDGVNLSGADLNRADLEKAHLENADLVNANLYGVNLSEAYLTMVDLRQAMLLDTDLAEADLYGTDLEDAYYEPRHNPPVSSIARADGLDSMRWLQNSEPIYALRKSLLDAGFVRQARQVNAAIHRHNQSWLERFVFDWTCEWGANWSRPLAIAAVLSLLCTFIYWIGMHFHTKSGLYLAATGERIATARGKERIFRIEVRPSRTAPATDQLELDLEPKPQARETVTKLRQRLRWEMNALGTAFLFSLMSVFNIGFREFNFGRWIRMLQTHEFDIRARGWMRTVSGVQSLIGVALVALSLLSYFGHPFD